MGLFGGNAIAFSFLLSCCLIIRLRYRPRIETRRDSERAAPPLWVSTNGEWERFPLWALGYLFLLRNVDPHYSGSLLSLLRLGHGRAEGRKWKKALGDIKQRKVFPRDPTSFQSDMDALPAHAHWPRRRIR